MSNALLVPPTSASPQHTLTLSQTTPSYLSSQTSWRSLLPYPLTLFLSTESQEKWQIHENLFLSSLRAGDNETAFRCLEALISRFGDSNDRVVALRGLYQEAVAETTQELEIVLKMYSDMLVEDRTRFSIQKRRAALLRSMGRTSDAVTALTTLLDATPTDAEAWAELGDLYFSQGAYEQTVFCLEEVLLITPNAWNIHAKLGEVLLLSAARVEGSTEAAKLLAESMRRFCRSIELCDDYLRGYYGLNLSTTRLITVLSTNAKAQQQTQPEVASNSSSLPSLQSVQKLNALSAEKLASILRHASSNTAGWDGYNESELAAVRSLLDKQTQKIER